MENNSLSKFLGWVLLITGLLIIFYFLFSSYSIFTGQKEPPQVFKTLSLDSSAASTSLSLEDLTSAEKVQEFVEEKIKELLSSMLPPEHFTKLFNLVTWTILTGIFISGGAHISVLGIRLIKKQ